VCIQVIPWQPLVCTKPAAHAPVLEPLMQAVGEDRLRLVGADEAGLHLAEGGGT